MNYILDALEMVCAWNLPDDELADAVNAQARLMAGIHPDDFWEGNAEYALTDHPYRKSFQHSPPLHSNFTPISMHPSQHRRTAFVRSIVLSGGRWTFSSSGDSP